MDVVDGSNKDCFASTFGVAVRLGILKLLVPLYCCTTGLWVVGESKEVCGIFREGKGERILGSRYLGGDWGDCIVTRGGDLVGERGGEKATIEVGRAFGVPQGERNPVLPRRVTDPVAVKSAKFGVELRGLFSLGMSKDILPSSLLWSSGMRNRSGVLGVDCRGGPAAGAMGDLLEVSIFSKWLRREETGFYERNHVSKYCENNGVLTHDGRAIGALLCGVVHSESPPRQPAPGSELHLFMDHPGADTIEHWAKL